LLYTFTPPSSPERWTAASPVAASRPHSIGWRCSRPCECAPTAVAHAHAHAHAYAHAHAASPRRRARVYCALCATYPPTRLEEKETCSRGRSTTRASTTELHAHLHERRRGRTSRTDKPFTLLTNVQTPIPIPGNKMRPRDAARKCHHRRPTVSQTRSN
jgi:hypothetical protein